MVATSENLVLEDFGCADLTDEFLSWFDDKNLMRYFTESQKKITKEEIISTFLNPKTKRTDQHLYKIIYRANILVGTIKIITINKTHNTGDVAVLIDKKHHLRGFGIEAVKLGSSYAINHLNFRKLFGGIYESNLGSVRVYTKAGWKIEGRLKGYYLVNGIPEDKILISYEEVDLELQTTKDKMNFNLAY